MLLINNIYAESNNVILFACDKSPSFNKLIRMDNLAYIFFLI